MIHKKYLDVNNYRPTFITMVCILIIFLLLPLFYWTKSDISYEIPKVWLFNRTIEVVGISIFFLLSKLKQPRDKIDLLIILIVYYFYLFGSSVFGVDFQKSIIGNYYRSDGLFTLGHLLILFIFIYLFIDSKMLKNFFKFTVVGVFILSTWTVFEAGKYFLLGPNSANHWSGAFGISFGNPNFLGGYLSSTLLLTYHQITTSRNFFWKLTFALQLIAVILTKSIGAIFVVLLGVWYIFAKRINKKISIILGLLVLLFVSSSYLQQVKNNTITNRVTAESRERILYKGFLAFQQKPLFGWGWANFDYAFESVDWPIKFENDAYVDKAHSSFLEVLVASGIIGLYLYLVIIFLTVKKYVNERTDTFNILAITFIFIVIHMQTNIVSISEEILFWSLCGIASALPIKD